MYQPLTPEQLKRAEERLRHPAAGSRIQAAKDYGIDLVLLIEQLRLTPAERGRKLQRADLAGDGTRHCAEAPLMDFEGAVQALCGGVVGCVIIGGVLIGFVRG